MAARRPPRRRPPTGVAVGLRSTGPFGRPSAPSPADSRLPGHRPGIQIGSRADQAADAHTLELAVVGEHSLGGGVRDLVRAQPRTVPGAILHAGQHSGNAQPDVPAPHLGEGHRVVPAALAINVPASNRRQSATGNGFGVPRLY